MNHGHHDSWPAPKLVSLLIFQIEIDHFLGYL